MLIALFERAVGLYASLININAYHQHGVEAGKKAAGKVIETQLKVLDFLSQQPGTGFSVEEISKGIGAEDDVEHIFKICEYLSTDQKRIICKSFDESILKRKYAII